MWPVADIDLLALLDIVAPFSAGVILGLFLASLRKPGTGALVETGRRFGARFNDKVASARQIADHQRQVQERRRVAVGS